MMTGLADKGTAQQRRNMADGARLTDVTLNLTLVIMVIVKSIASSRASMRIDLITFQLPGFVAGTIGFLVSRTLS
jgi:hypothetical protein